MANSLETFRRLAQANLERDQLNRRVLQASAAAAGSQSALAAAAVSLTTPGLTASDYMRFAMPVRDPDNGDAISGSGEKLGLKVRREQAWKLMVDIGRASHPVYAQQSPSMQRRQYRVAQNHGKQVLRVSHTKFHFLNIWCVVMMIQLVLKHEMIVLTFGTRLS